ncbi:hypothetical protein G7054_g8990 [Neopestalotiopsis clavispora]|nr:hypothetical protein G7054_g8990 [Neopestalotiopsis clavispora]
MADSTHHDFRAEYDQAVTEFLDLRQRYTRTSLYNQEFVLVNQITQHLQRSKSDRFSTDLRRLLFLAQQAYKGGPPDLTSGELETCQTIFYILIELGTPDWLSRFHYHGIRDSHLPIDIADLETKFKHNGAETGGAAEHDKFLQNFCDLQYAWCPMLFRLNMGGDSHRDRVIPLYEKEQIIVRRDGATLQHSHSSLWKVVVPADCISPELQSKMEGTTCYRRVNNGHAIPRDDEDYMEECYRFVVKEFQTSGDSASEEERFKTEMSMTKQLKDSDGILQYFGWYQCPGFDGCQSFNLLLELGECDFYTYIRTYYPPVLTLEITRFWEHMVDLSVGLKEIHTLRLDDVDYDMCHGDIKPENIISVKGRFKIADPAEGCIVPSISGNHPQAATIGGTITYASPEKSQNQESSTSDLSEIRKIPLNSDVWSLGCVFSVAATYVVLGKLGVEEYDELRRKANIEVRGKNSDTFHDGSNVLLAVHHWHDYLRRAARGTDMLTKAVLDFVDRHMLVSDHMNRSDASGVVKLLTEILHAHTQNQDTATESPQDITEFLQSLEQDVDALSIQESEQSYSRTHDAFGFQLLDRSDTLSIRQPTSQRLQQQQIRTSGSRTFSNGQKRRENTTLNLDHIMTNRWTYSTLNSPLENVNELQSVIDMWMVEDDLQRHQKADLLGRKRQRSVKKEKQTSQDKDDELKNFFNNRDLVFLVDNSRSMLPHWNHAMYLIRILTWRALGYDEDGMELYFTETLDHVKQKKNQKVTDFLNVMTKAKPNMRNSASSNGIVKTLNNILNNPLQPPQDRPKTIIILTDGVWEGLANDEAMDSLIRYHLDALPEDVKRLDKRPITFQFISFGYNKEALERLRRLDDDIQLEDYPDFVDTEHATGDVYKMFLGSLSQEIDQAEYYCPRCGTNQTTSPMTPRPLRHRSHSDTRDWA